MIPVKKQPEPNNFDKLVRVRGRNYLKKVRKPTSKEFGNHAYWRDIIPDMHKLYKGICAYSAHWIPVDTANPTIDHFKPKTVYPEFAYEWDNYRLAASKYNTWKGTKKILDPFLLKPDSCVLDFQTLEVRPNENLSHAEKQKVIKTIEILKLNIDEVCLLARETWLMEYCNKDITFSHLERRAPFIAYELKRQGLKETIGNQFNYTKVSTGEEKAV